MPLRMVFHQRDLQRVRIAAQPDPLWELVLALVQARAPGGADRYAAWRSALRERLSRLGRQWPRRLTLLGALVPPQGSFPDFLTPAPVTSDLDAGCEAVALTARTRLRMDVAASFAGRPVPSWVRALADGDRDQLREVVGAVRDAHELLLAPQWGVVQDVVATDRVTRVRTLADQGIGAVLTGLPGVRSWDGRVLTAAYPETRTVDLAGRGIVLVPSYFCSGTPVTFIDPALPPILIYSAGRPGVTPDSDPTLSRTLIALLGRTRAECLHALRTPGTTTTLAQRLDTSPGTASKHTAVLREAGLIATARHGGSALHSLTPLGAALLDGGIRTAGMARNGSPFSDGGTPPTCRG